MDISDYINNQPLPVDAELDQYFRHRSHLTIFEIGACEGEDSIRLRRKFPNAEIHTFEPLPKNVERIKKNIKKFKASDIKVNQLAMSDQDGESVFFVSSGHPEDAQNTEDWDYGNKSSSLLAPKEAKKVTKWLRFNDEISVKTQRLDTYCAKNAINRIDFIFMDVQGAEMMVLKGAGDLIKNIGMVWLEVGTVELYKGQPLKNDIQEFMEKNGFYCAKEVVYNEAGDQLYVNKNLKKLLAPSLIHALDKHLLDKVSGSEKTR